MSQRDVLFIASWSGNIDKYRESLLSLDGLGTSIVSITNFHKNELARIAPYNLYFQSTSIDEVRNINRSSYLTLHLVLHLLYDGYIDYSLKRKETTLKNLLTVAHLDHSQEILIYQVDMSRTFMAFPFSRSRGRR